MLLSALLALSASAVRAAPVLMISIDGLRPADVLEADARGLKLPTLRGLVGGGAYASGVRDALPSVTYPNHTTLVTGVWPAQHRIAANGIFDPTRKYADQWFWYADAIKAPTLWQAVRAAGRTSASVHWPVTVSAPFIDYNLPEYWRTRDKAPDTGLERAVSTPGLPEAIAAQSGQPVDEVLDQVGTEPANDTVVAKTAAAIYALKKPYFFTLHLASLDHYQHVYGPGSPEAKAALEQIDADVGGLIAAARKAEPDLVVAIVSDHGFAPVEHDINIAQPFIEAGLIKVDAAGKVTSWDAAPWPAGASAGVVLARRDDAALKAKVAELLAKLQADPASGVGRVLDRAGVAQMGGVPDVDFYVDSKIGYEMEVRLKGPLVTTPGSNKGTHGYFPDHPEMRATLIIQGPGVAKKGPLGEVDMRDIAPTVAKIMNVGLPSAAGRPLF
jgi:predicted AlkP superfamily pyrophosphatase or phosphodiesterase